MKFKDQAIRTDDNEDKILPLINVVFLLLIFFMIAGALTPVDPFELEAPVSMSDAPVERDDFQIFISNDGEFALNTQVLARAQVLEQIAYSVEHGSMGIVEIKVDKSAAGNLVISLMNKLKELGVERVNLITEQQI